MMKKHGCMLCLSILSLLAGRGGGRELSWRDVDGAAAAFSAPASAEPRLAPAAQPPRPVPRVRCCALCSS